MTQGTALKVGIKNAEIVKYGNVYKVGSFKVLPFRTYHDAIQPCGYVIDCPDGNRVVFATDTHHLNYKFVGADYLMVECNYEERLLAKSTEEGRVPMNVAKRVRLTHLSVDRCLRFIKNNAEKAKGIILLHLSHENSNRETFKRKIQQATGKMVYCAEKDLDINFL